MPTRGAARPAEYQSGQEGGDDATPAEADERQTPASELIFDRFDPSCSTNAATDRPTRLVVQRCEAV